MNQDILKTTPVELDEGKLRAFVLKQEVTKEGCGLNHMYTIWQPEWCPLYTSDVTLEAVWEELIGDLKVLWDEFVNVEEEKLAQSGKELRGHLIEEFAKTQS